MSRGHMCHNITVCSECQCEQSRGVEQRPVIGYNGISRPDKGCPKRETELIGVTEVVTTGWLLHAFLRCQAAAICTIEAQHDEHVEERLSLPRPTSARARRYKYPCCEPGTALDCQRCRPQLNAHAR